MIIKIAHCISSLEIGGAEMMLYKAVTHMNSQLFANLVIPITGFGPLAEKLQKRGIKVLPLFKPQGIPDPRVIWKLYSILKKEQVNILQTYMDGANFYGLIASKLAKIPIIWGLRCSNMDFQKYKLINRITFFLNSWLSSWPDIIIANSENGLKYHISKGYNNKHFVIIPNGFDLDLFRPNNQARKEICQELAISTDSFLVGLIARFDPMKDHHTFLKAASIVAKTHLNVYFILAGKNITSTNNILSQWIREMGLERKVFLLGHRNDIPKLMSSFDVLVSSSSFGEGFPNVIGEAMACGIPCIVTDVGDSAKIVNGFGQVIPPQNPQALANALEKFISMPLAEREQLGKTARQWIKENFDIYKVVTKLEQLYTDLFNTYIRHNS